ncbi:hypothetical protein FSP39_012928 [Pinctada imbricata]|uniref:Torsin-1A-interacting protein 1/2 AAA+ activator domain-containing protein n=1 Tax=Pinctada imbricata TaxID=66713 RepID=A0AA88XP79_PINIB|nr:hypothetical protein FSP39_012928 [Pinctada imbricata]
MSGTTRGMTTRSRSKGTGSPSLREPDALDTSRDSSVSYRTDDEDESEDSSSPMSRGKRTSDDTRSSPDPSPLPRKNLYPKLSTKDTPESKPTKRTGRLYPDIHKESEKEKRLQEEEKRSPPKRNTNQASENTSSSGNMFIFVIVIIMLFAAYYLQLHEKFISQNNVSNTYSGVPEKNLYDDFRSNLKELQSAFAEQDRRLWRVIHAPIRRILMEEEPTYPAVLLFVVPKEQSSEKTATCLAQKVLAAVNNTYDIEGLAYINSNSVRNRDSAKEKRDLDDRLKEILEEKYQMGVVVDHIEQLSPFAMLLFHGYCDGDNAPYKKSVIVLVMHTDQDFHVLQNEDAVDDLLFKNWKIGLEEDKIPPLIARVANNKVVVKGEHPNVLKTHC